MDIQFLGTGAGMPSKQRNVTSIALKLLDEIGSVWLFDCGEATQHQLLETSIRPRRIDKIFITHMHGDHIFGLPGFLSSRSFLGGTTPLTIYGPKGIRAFIETSLSCSCTHLTYELIIHEIEDGVIIDDAQFTVTAQTLRHVIPSFGFRIEQKTLPGQLLIDKAIQLGVPKGPLLGQLKSGQNVTLQDGRTIYSHDVVTPPKNGFVATILGDTAYCKEAIHLAKNADVLIHEATFDATTSHLAKDYGHATNVEAATVAKQANAKNLILTHISARFVGEAIHSLVQQAQTHFPHTYIANDFAIFELRDGTLKQH